MRGLWVIEIDGVRVPVTGIVKLEGVLMWDSADRAIDACDKRVETVRDACGLEVAKGPEECERIYIDAYVVGARNVRRAVKVVEMCFGGEEGLDVFKVHEDATLWLIRVDEGLTPGDALAAGVVDWDLQAIIVE